MTPQQIEAMKLALEALEYALNKPMWNRPKMTVAINALEEALAQEQKPVAIKRMKEWIEYLKRKSDFGQHMKIPSEMSAGTCWELALELEQFINTTPPQRKPLTHEQRFDVLTKFEPHKHEWHAPAILIDLVEAAHGIKE